MSAKEMSETNQIRPRIETWLGIQPAAKPRVYEQVFAAAAINSLSYWLGIFFSAGIATFGLVESSPAVIIGAMLISPLMGPIMGTGLALAVGDFYLGIKAVLNLVFSVTVSIAFSGFLVWLLPFHSVTAEIVARTNPNLLDLGIALLSGLAGSVVVCRGGGEGVTALPGVAIAVALMPPLCTVGFGLGSGRNPEIMGGAGLLFLTNLVAIVASAFLVFLLGGLNTAEVRQVMTASRRDEALSRMLSHGPVAKILLTGGKMHWRVLTLLLLLASIAVPLSKALLQVANETLTRSAVQQALRRLVPADAVVSQRVTVGKEEILIRVVSTSPISDAKVSEARQYLVRRTGHEVRLSVEAVASKRELAEMMERLAQPAPAVVPKQKSVAEIRMEVLDKIGPVIQEIWPSADAPIQDFDVRLDAAGIEIGVRYLAAKELDGIAFNMVQKVLRTRLENPDLILKVERIRPVKPSRNLHETGDKKRGR